MDDKAFIRKSILRHERYDHQKEVISNITNGKWQVPFLRREPSSCKGSQASRTGHFRAKRLKSSDRSLSSKIDLFKKIVKIEEAILEVSGKIGEPSNTKQIVITFPRASDPMSTTQDYRVSVNSGETLEKQRLVRR